MKKISKFLSENFQFLEVKFSVYLNRRVFIMKQAKTTLETGGKFGTVLYETIFLRNQPSAQ